MQGGERTPRISLAGDTSSAWGELGGVQQAQRRAHSNVFSSLYSSICVRYVSYHGRDRRYHTCWAESMLVFSPSFGSTRSAVLLLYGLF